MVLETIVSLFVLILIIALYVWAWKRLRAKWDQLDPFWAVMYCLMFFLPGVGPVPLLFLLYLNVGVNQSYHANKISVTAP
jgi:hypothetical protein